MPAQIINGKELAKSIREEIKEKVSKMDTKPGLAVVRVGEDPASKIYVNHKHKACQEAGIKSEVIVLDDCSLGKRLSGPMQLFGSIDYTRQTKPIDVHADLVPLYGFYLEVLRGYNFGSLLPGVEDTVVADAHDMRTHVLRPEFIIATKLFKMRSIRDVDLEDVARLSQKFKLDFDYLHSLVSQTPFQFLSKQEVQQCLEEITETSAVPQTLSSVVFNRVLQGPYFKELKDEYTFNLSLMFLPDDSSAELTALK